MTALLIIFAALAGACAGFFVAALITSGASDDAYRAGYSAGQAQGCALQVAMDTSYGGTDDDD